MNVVAHLMRRLLLLALTASLAFAWTPGQPGRAEPEQAASLSPEDTTLYLPLVLRPRYASPFGVQLLWFENTNVNQAKQAQTYWLRSFAFDWSKIEPTLAAPRAYDWSKVDEAGLQVAGQSGINLMATIKYTPAWAQKVPGSYCGPVAADKLDEYAAFVEELVRRYSVAPYNVRYWEFGNEPDVDPTIISSTSPFGCWGDKNDPNYGGGYYAEMLKQVYPAIKRADPQAQVVIGGLLMSCDPVHPPKGRDCTPSRFINGILANGGGAYFDYANFHGYAYFDGTKIVEETHSDWAQSGGIVFGKYNYLRSTMASYGVDKPVILSEASLVCPESVVGCQPPGSTFLELQADYVVRLYARAWAQGIKGVIWYALDDSSWRSSSLKSYAALKPSYHAYQTMGSKLYDTRAIWSITGYSGVQGYEFVQADRKVWVLWSTDGLPHTIALPQNWLAVSDKYGSPITPVNGQVTVNSPIYVDVGF